MCTCLQLSAVELDEAPVREKDLLPHNSRAQRRRALEPLLLQSCLRGLLLCRCRGVWPAAPDLWCCCPGLQGQAGISRLQCRPRYSGSQDTQQTGSTMRYSCLPIQYCIQKKSADMVVIGASCPAFHAPQKSHEIWCRVRLKACCQFCTCSCLRDDKHEGLQAVVHLLSTLGSSLHRISQRLGKIQMGAPLCMTANVTLLKMQTFLQLWHIRVEVAQPTSPSPSLLRGNSQEPPSARASSFLSTLTLSLMKLT